MYLDTVQAIKRKVSHNGVIPVITFLFIWMPYSIAIYGPPLSQFLKNFKSFWDLKNISSTCALTGFFWLLSHVIYLKLTRVLQDYLLSKLQFLNDELQLHPKKQFGNVAKLFWSFYQSKIEAWERRQSCNTLVSLR